MLLDMHAIPDITDWNTQSIQSLDHFNIQHEKITCFGLEIHNIQVEPLTTLVQLDDLYQHFNIFFPLNIKNAGLIRQLEFFTGRLAAKYALHDLNLQDCVIHQGHQGEPIWPDAVIGSISHVSHPRLCCAIAYAQKHNCADKTFGIDIESKKCQTLFQQNDEIYHVFLSEDEQAALANTGFKKPDLYLLVFSAKESVIKAFYIKYKQIIDFKSIRFDGIVDDFIWFRIHLGSSLKNTIVTKVHFFDTDNEIITISCI
ncbi:4'-phosphopantetheinyl transferase family protein [Acinetobacter haemolyticus]|uniref:4'-phosphopantetheinyl transferase family protein n=1 Tax=Acinetobacter haemolyticus TaxID=29430 RepID=UPI000DEBCA5A|nr:4'-phosphopantetheinyl transferase superfamily protein [Acinetobacter haemolyticus]WHR57506.1 4'-phosphopantetheinyl transferase superfamily protein [Acinetobacter haemolyticus]